jgi:hypothetical protein
MLTQKNLKPSCVCTSMCAYLAHMPGDTVPLSKYYKSDRPLQINVRINYQYNAEM